MRTGVDTDKGSLAVAAIDDARWLRERLEVPNTEAGFDRIVGAVGPAWRAPVGIEGLGN